MFLKFLKKIIVLVLLPFSVSIFANHSWDWNSIDTDDTYFPDNFLWGTATAEYQNSGAAICFDNNWAEWERKRDSNGDSRIEDGQVSNTSADHWNRYKDDIKLMKELGVNSYRFSIEWSLIEPEEGQYDLTVVKHYKDLIKELKQNGITPLVTMHHFTNPRWFEAKKAFEKEENIQYFVNFATFIFDQFSNEVELWCTFNEPALYTFMGYVFGKFPPGEKKLSLAGEVLKNMFIAHSDVYEKLSSHPNRERTKIGIVHNFLKMEPYSKYNPIEVIATNVLSKITNDIAFDFLKTGEYNYEIPFMVNVSFEDKRILETVDFIGLNYYSHPILKSQFSFTDPLIPANYPHEVMGDMPFRLYPQGIYEAIVRCSELNIPIYITENGIPDKTDDKRGLYIKRYLYAVSHAIKEGYDVRGYFYWTLMDNFEWNEGYNIKFGLYEVDFETKERYLRDGARSYVEIIEKWNQENQLATN